jgi:hypothetical protein
MIRYRTNAKLIKKLTGGRRCMLEALVFATGMHLGALGCTGFSTHEYEHGIPIHDINVKLMEHTPYKLCKLLAPCHCASVEASTAFLVVLKHLLEGRDRLDEVENVWFRSSDDHELVVGEVHERSDPLPLRCAMHRVATATGPWHEC